MHSNSESYSLASKRTDSVGTSLETESDFVYDDDLLTDVQMKFSAVEQSPHEEVAASVPNTDDATTVNNSFRMWFLGVLFTGAISVINQFFAFRTSPLLIGPLIVQVLAMPAGKFLEYILPKRIWRIGKWHFSLNPGPFSMKEHTVITIMSNTTTFGYGMELITVMRIYYNRTVNHGVAIFLVLTAQILGYGMAGKYASFLLNRLCSKSTIFQFQL
ncbi:unnamed protein product [Didymodactylos carnosus]|uniref:Oligopeptide transporter n=1 Tax=Didymodactylos carnosus TaxID=1234261 RepID=A0A8S2E7D6_9BILA|nr:unnamed protein product [Didymodactylos carnosus]CAF3913384.1 unnamed protein product [Didymodactylos carnosus]